jgi:hypothetical protein
MCMSLDRGPSGILPILDGILLCRVHQLLRGSGNKFQLNSHTKLDDVQQNWTISNKIGPFFEKIHNVFFASHGLDLQNLYYQNGRETLSGLLNFKHSTLEQSGQCTLYTSPLQCITCFHLKAGCNYKFNKYEKAQFHDLTLQLSSYWRTPFQARRCYVFSTIHL